MRRWGMAALGMMLMMGMLLAGCGGKTEDNGTSGAEPSGSAQENEAAAEPMKIVVALGVGGNAARQEFFDKWAGDFNKAHPGVTVENIDPGSTLMGEFLKTKFAANDLPDLMIQAPVKEFVEAGAIQPIPQEVRSLLKTENEGLYKGEKYIAEYTLSPMGMFYNKDLFAKYNLQPPQTYAEYLNICKALKDNSVTPISISMKDAWAGSWNYMFAFGNDVYGANPSWDNERNADKVKFQSPEVRKSFEQFAELSSNGYFSKGSLSTTYDQSVQQFASGDAAMIANGAWFTSDVQGKGLDFPVGFFVVPQDDGPGIVSYVGTEGLSMKADLDDRKQQMVTELLKSFFSPDTFPLFLKTVGGLGTTKELIQGPVPEGMEELVDDIFNTYKNNTNHIVMAAAAGDDAWVTGVQDLIIKNLQEIVAGKTDFDRMTKGLDDAWNQGKL